MAHFGSGERFKSSKEVIPGPGQYDVALPKGFKADPKSGFLGAERFNELEKEGYAPDISPPRERMKAPGSENRKFSWATQRIHDLEVELERTKKALKDLRVQAAQDKQQFDTLALQQHGLIQLLEKEKEATEARCRQAEEEAADQLSSKAALEGELQAAKEELARLADELRGASQSAEQRHAALEEASTRMDGLDSQLKVAQGQTDALQSRLTQLETELGEKDDTILQLRVSSAEAQAANLELTHRLDDAVVARGVLERTLDDEQTAILELKRDLELERTRAEESKAMGAAKDTELATAIQRQSALMLQNHQLQAHMAAMTEEHAALEDRHRDVLEELAERGLQVTAAEEALVQLEAQAKADLSSVKDQAESASKESAAREASLAHEVDCLREVQKDLQEQLSTAGADLAATQSSLHACKDDLLGVQNKLQASEAALTAAKSLAQEVEERLQCQLTTMQHERAVCEAQLQKQLTAAVQALRTTQADNEANAETQRRREQALRAQLAVLMDELKDAEGNLASAELRATACDAANEHLQVQLGSLKEEATRSAEVQEELSGAVKSLEEKLQSAKQETAEIQAASQMESKLLQADVVVRDAQITDLLAQIAQAKEQVAQLDLELSSQLKVEGSLRAELEDLLAAEQAASAEVQALNQALISAEAVSKARAEALELAAATNAAAQEQLGAAHEALTEKDEALEEARGRQKELEGQLGLAIQENDQQRSSCQDTERQLASAHQTTAELRDQLVRQAEAAQALNQALSSVEGVSKAQAEALEAAATAIAAGEGKLAAAHVALAEKDRALQDLQAEAAVAHLEVAKQTSQLCAASAALEAAEDRAAKVAEELIRCESARSASDDALRMLNAKVAPLEAAKAAALQDGEALAAQLAECRGELALAQGQITALTDREKALDSALNNVTAERDTMQVEAADLAAAQQALEDKYSVLFARHADAMAAEARLTTSLQEVTRDATEKAGQVARLESSLSALQDEHCSALAHTVDLEARMATVQSAYAAEVEAKDGLAKELADATQRISQLDMDLIHKQASAAAAEEALQASVSELQNQLAHSVQQVADLTQALSGAQAELQGARDTAQRSLEEASERQGELEGRLGLAIQENELQHSLCRDLESQLAQQAEAAQEAAAASAAAVAALDMKLGTTVELLQRREEELAESRSMAAQAQVDLEGQVAEAHKRLEALSCQAQEQQTCLTAQLEEASAHVVQYEGELNVAGELMTAAKVEVEGLRGTLAALEEQLATSQRHVASGEATVGQLQSQLEFQRAEAASRGLQLDQARSEIADLHASLKTQGAELTDVNGRLDAAQGALAAVTNEKECCIERADHLEEGLASLRGELAEANRVNHQLKADLAALEERAKESKKAAEEATKALASELAEKQVEAASHLADLAAVQENAAKMEGELADACDLVAHLRCEMDHLREALGAEQARTAQRDEEFSTISAELQAVQMAGAKLSVELKASQVAREALGAAQARSAQLEEELSVVRDELLATQHAAEQMQADLQTAQAEAARAHEKYAALREEAQRTLADSSETAALEMQRLVDENTLLGHRILEVEGDLQDMLVKPMVGLGHSNPKQPIQYHLRLKQELEEMRRECTLLLRDRFQLEQCIRYLAARCTGAAGEVAVVSERRRSSLARVGVQPASLVQSPLFATPLGRTTMLRAGRSKKATELGPTWQSKEDIVASIEHTVQDTATSLKSLTNDLGMNGEKENSGAAAHEPSPSWTRPCPLSLKPDAEENSSHDPAVEARIIARIATICSPQTKYRRSRLSQVEGGVLSGPEPPRSPLGSCNRDFVGASPS